MKQTSHSRRKFLQGSGSALAATWAAMSLPAMLATAESSWAGVDVTADFKNLSAEEAADLEAVTGQIIPTDDTPGAREAGVVYFIDAGLGTFLAGVAVPLADGLADIRSKVAEQFPDETSFAALDNDQQLQVMEIIQSEGYFGLIQYITMLGMLSHPKYGGNRDKIGWKMMRFDDRHAWVPPFGYYDAEYRKNND